MLLIAGSVLMPDYFLGDSMPQLPKEKKQAKSVGAKTSGGGSSADVNSVFDAMKSAITPQIVEQIGANFEFRLKGTQCFLRFIYMKLLLQVPAMIRIISHWRTEHMHHVAKARIRLLLAKLIA